jgi:hypothetical protein
MIVPSRRRGNPERPAPKDPMGSLPQILRARYARLENDPIDDGSNRVQTAGA